MGQISTKDFGDRISLLYFPNPFFLSCLVLVEQNLAGKINPGEIDTSGEKGIDFQIS